MLEVSINQATLKFISCMTPVQEWYPLVSNPLIPKRNIVSGFLSLFSRQLLKCLWSKKIIAAYLKGLSNKKIGVFLFRISFFVLEIFTFSE